MNGFYNKPLFRSLVWKAIAEHHFQMSQEHLQLFMNVIDDN